jgi:hypothetical protein
MADIEQTRKQLCRPVADQADESDPDNLLEAFDCICDALKCGQPLRWGELAGQLSKRTPKVWNACGPIQELVRNLTDFLLAHTGHVIASAVENRNGRWNRDFYSDAINLGMLPSNPSTQQRKHFRLVQWNWWRRKIAGHEANELEDELRATIRQFARSCSSAPTKR